MITTPTDPRTTHDVVTCTNTKALWGRRQTAAWLRDVVVPHADMLAALRFFACLPAPLLAESIDALRGTGVEVGAQDAWPDDGTHTGQVPVSLLAEIGCRQVMLGHAEHRRDSGETDALVARKAAAAVAAGVRPLVCVGETEHVPAAEAAGHVTTQARTTLDAVPAGAEVLFLYEPAWAIGAPQGAPPGHVAEVLRAVHDAVSSGAPPRLLYGGGVVPGTWTALRAAGAPLAGLGLGRAVRDPGMLREVADELLPASAPAPAER